MMLMRNTGLRALQATREGCATIARPATARVSPTRPWAAAGAGSTMCPHCGHPGCKLSQSAEHRAPVLRRVFFLTPFVVELELESWCVATCDFRAPKLLLPTLSSSLGADWLLLLNITLTFPAFFSEDIPNIFQSKAPEDAIFISPVG